MFRWYLGKTIQRGRMVLIEANGRETKFGEDCPGPALAGRLTSIAAELRTIVESRK